jgi:hypothetical protein
VVAVLDSRRRFPFRVHSTPIDAILGIWGIVFRHLTWIPGTFGLIDECYVRGLMKGEIMQSGRYVEDELRFV